MFKSDRQQVQQTEKTIDFSHFFLIDSFQLISSAHPLAIALILAGSLRIIAANPLSVTQRGFERISNRDMDLLKSLLHRHVSIKDHYQQHQSNVTLRTLGGATEQIKPIVSPFHYAAFPVPAHQTAQMDWRMALEHQAQSASTSDLGDHRDEAEAPSNIGRLSKESDVMEEAFDPFSSYLVDPALYNASCAAVESGDEASYKPRRKDRKLKASVDDPFEYAGLDHERSKLRNLALYPELATRKRICIAP